LRGAKIVWSLALFSVSNSTQRFDTEMIGSSMGQQEAADFARDWVTAWNDRDVEAVLGHFADDAVFSLRSRTG
jgi:hypothetical protein